MDYQQRIDAVREKLAEWEVDGLLVSSPINRRWLTGFGGSFGYVLITQKMAQLATDGRYWARVEEESPDYELVRYKREPNALAQFLSAPGAQRIGIEAQHVTLSGMKQYEKIDGLTFVPLETTVELLRDVKTAAEIGAIRAAAAITDRVMAEVNTIAHPGMTEKRLAWELERRMREYGADRLAFDIIVASGPNGARPHHAPGERAFAEGDAITIDMGAARNGYHSDLTRTFHMGVEPSDKFWSVYNAVKEAHAHALAHVRPGMSGKEADSLARDVIEAAGYGEAFTHSLGHGVGLEIHEGPRMAQPVNSPLPVGGVVTIEPGIYLDDWSGVRIEDLVVLREDGAERLSHCPQTPLIPL